MSEKRKKGAARLCEALVLGSLVVVAVFALLPGYAMDLHVRLFYAACEIALALAAGLALYCKGDEGQKRAAVRRTAGLLLAVYLVHLLSLLFFDGTFGRQGGFSWEAMGLRLNLQPFKTIRGYWLSLQRHRINTSIVVINLLGNLLALAPLGVLLPLVWGRMRRLLPSLLLGAAFIVLIELTQLVTGTGSCDIDDFILNFAGFALARGAMGLVLRKLEKRGGW